MVREGLTRNSILFSTALHCGSPVSSTTYELPVVYAYLMLICRRTLWKWSSKSYTPITTQGMLASLVGIFCVARKVLLVLKEVDGVDKAANGCGEAACALTHRRSNLPRRDYYKAMCDAMNHE